MPGLDAPSIESFLPTKSYSAVGLDFVRMQNADGVTLDLSEGGAAEADQNPEISALLARMGDFIAEHGEYGNVKAVSAVEPGNIPKVSEARRGHYHCRRLVSIYHHDSAPSAIVKAYDYDRKSAAPQFYLGNWMHTELARADNGVQSAAQFAKFTAATAFRGHQTVVMEFIPGQDLYLWAFSSRNCQEYERNEVEAAVNSLRTQTKQRIREALGWRASIIANDLRVRGNIILSDPDIPPSELVDQNITVIDQPAVRMSNSPLVALARRAPILRANREPRPVEA